MNVLPPPSRKRVHFSQADASVDDGSPKHKKPRFPKGRKRAVGFEGEEDGPGFNTNPQAAAKERAMRRTLLAEQQQNVENGIDDIAGAEEEYEPGDDEEENGVRIEPFNLNQEREEGYFDAEGNYVEYRVDNSLKDAWLDSVEMGTALKSKPAQPTEGKQEAEGLKELSLNEFRAIKRRIADVLQTGETVLNALRRLKGSPKDGKRIGRMSEATKAIFDQLTEDAMNLLDDGDIDVYSKSKEDFLDLAEIQTTSFETNGSASLQTFGDSAGAGDGFDMFGDDNDRSTNPGQVTAPGALQSDDGAIQSGNNVVSAEVPAESSGYILDESTGYFYNSDLGYYYDPNSGLFCNAMSGNWFRFDEASNQYVQLSTDVNAQFATPRTE